MNELTDKLRQKQVKDLS